MQHRKATQHYLTLLLWEPVPAFPGLTGPAKRRPLLPTAEAPGGTQRPQGAVPPAHRPGRSGAPFTLRPVPTARAAPRGRRPHLLLLLLLLLLPRGSKRTEDGRKSEAFRLSSALTRPALFCSALPCPRHLHGGTGRLSPRPVAAALPPPPSRPAPHSGTARRRRRSRTRGRRG